MTHSDQWMDEIRIAARELTELRAPAEAWQRIAARIDEGDAVVLPAAAPVRPRWRPAAVAALLLLCAGVAAALVPQTGLRAWIERQFGGSPEIETPPPTTQPDATAELAVPLVGGAVHVELTNAAAPLQLRVRTGNGPDLGVLARGGAAGALFIAGAGRLTIEGAAGGEIILNLPQHAGLVTIRVDGVRVIEARGTAITVLAPHADTIGTELIVPIR